MYLRSAFFTCAAVLLNFAYLGVSSPGGAFRSSLICFNNMEKRTTLYSMGSTEQVSYWYLLPFKFFISTLGSLRHDSITGGDGCK